MKADNLRPDQLAMIRHLEEKLGDLYWTIVKYKDIPELNRAAGSIEAYQFMCAQLRGYEGD